MCLVQVLHWSAHKGQVAQGLFDLICVHGINALGKWMNPIHFLSCSNCKFVYREIKFVLKGRLAFQMWALFRLSFPHTWVKMNPWIIMSFIYEHMECWVYRNSLDNNLTYRKYLQSYHWYSFTRRKVVALWRKHPGAVWKLHIWREQSGSTFTYKCVSKHTNMYISGAFVYSCNSVQLQLVIWSTAPLSGRVRHCFPACFWLRLFQGGQHIYIKVQPLCACDHQHCL